MWLWLADPHLEERVMVIMPKDGLIPYNQPVYFQMAIYLIQTYTHMCNNNIEHNNNIKISIFINHKLLQYTH